MTLFRRSLLLPLAAPFLSLPAAVLILGFWPVSPDVPALAAGTGNTPGDGGLRRPFPPMSLRPDNPVTPVRVELGRLLFFDPVLSGANDVSCATCHHPDLGFADGRPLAMGRGAKGVGPERTRGTELPRGSPTIWNAAFNASQFWDGRARDLEDQARFPITSADEMDQEPGELVRELRSIPEYQLLFDRAFGGAAGAAVTFENVVRAIAAFERTLVSDGSRFDRYRAGDAGALTPSERRGLTLFRSLKTRCFECHGFPTFANPDFKVIGVPPLPGRPDDRGRAEVAGSAAQERAFKVPTLRNVALTAPYMHNGRFRTLEEVIDFYAKGGGPGLGFAVPNLDDKVRILTLTAEERADLVAFLGALTDESRRPEVPERVPSGLPVVPRLPAGDRAAEAPPRPARALEERRSGARTLTVKAGGSIQAAVDRARPGDTIEVEPGRYRETVLVDADGITLRGLARGGERPVLDGDGELSDAVIASGHGFRLEGFAIRNYRSNGATAHGATGVVFRDLVVDETGLYGVYPVECRDVLVERVKVSGARDAAIYVGQSRQIVVRESEAHHSVTGIEIENSVDALVQANHVHDNSGGILVFLLPNNPSKVGRDARVVGNRVIANNHPNFADPNATVARVPPGTGVFIMAADGTEVAGNEIRGNDSFGIAVVGLGAAFPGATSFDVGAVPEGTWIHDNRLADNGRNPAPAIRALGAVNADLLWDGSGWDNAWRQPGARAFPPWLPERTWPAFLRRAWSRAFSLLRDLGG
jgi:parallel beta-helix repeat protein